VEEQMMQMRAHMLRMEQEKELMRAKLEEEVAEREKAQKQVWGMTFEVQPAGPGLWAC
jgi:hypothetical protein